MFDTPKCFGNGMVKIKTLKCSIIELFCFLFEENLAWVSAATGENGLPTHILSKRERGRESVSYFSTAGVQNKYSWENCSNLFFFCFSILFYVRYEKKKKKTIKKSKKNNNKKKKKVSRIRTFVFSKFFLRDSFN